MQECLQQFKVTRTQLQQIQATLLDSMEQALKGQASPVPAVRMLPTYVGSTPHGTGGWHWTNMSDQAWRRILIVSLSSISKAPLTRFYRPWEFFWEAASTNLASYMASYDLLAP